MATEEEIKTAYKKVNLNLRVIMISKKGGVWGVGRGHSGEFGGAKGNVILTYAQGILCVIFVGTEVASRSCGKQQYRSRQ